MASPENPQFKPPADPAAEPASPFQGETPVLAPNQQGSLGSAPAPPAPVEDPIWSGWDVLRIAILAFVVILLLQMASAKAAQLLWYPQLPLRQAAEQLEKRPILLIVMQIVLYIPIALLMIATVEGKYQVPFWRAISWNWPRTVWKWIALGVVLLLVLSMFENLLPMPNDTPFQHLFDRPLDAYLTGLISITLAPLIEELFFRGLLYPVLARRTGMAWGVVLSAVPFALLHLPQYANAWAAGLVILVVGLVLGVVRAKTRSVGSSFLVHAGYNGIQLLIVLAITHGFTRMPKGLLEGWTR